MTIYTTIQDVEGVWPVPSLGAPDVAHAAAYCPVCGTVIVEMAPTMLHPENRERKAEAADAP